MNRNYKIRTLMNPDNWIRSGDNLVFVQLFGGRHEHEYPCSVYDAIRVIRQKFQAAGILAELNMRCEGWVIAVPSAAWNQAMKIMEETFYHHDFGDRLAIYQLDELSWDYNPAQPETFTRNADYVENAAEIAADLSDWTGFDVKFVDTSIDKGYWRVVLPTDEDRANFAASVGKYEKARKRIAEVMDNGVLLLTKEQYQRAKDALDAVRWKRITERNNMFVVAFDEDTYTREMISVLDAAGL